MTKALRSRLSRVHRQAARYTGIKAVPQISGFSWVSSHDQRHQTRKHVGPVKSESAPLPRDDSFLLATFIRVYLRFYKKARRSGRPQVIGT